MLRPGEGFTTFFQNIGQHGLVQRQLGNDLFQLGVLILKLFQLTHLVCLQTGIYLLPAIEGLLGDPDLAAYVAYGHPSGDLLQQRRNLLDRKALLLHGTPSWPMGRIVPRNTPSEWTEKPGAPHSAAVIR